MRKKKKKKRKKSHLFAYLRFCAFVILLGCIFVLLVLFVHVKSFRKKNNKEFKTALITSFVLLLKNPIMILNFKVLKKVNIWQRKLRSNRNPSVERN